MNRGRRSTDAGADRLTAALTRDGVDLLAYLRRRVDGEDAADLLGETMVVAWRRVADLPVEEERIRMWLFGIARGTLQNHARGSRRRRALADRVRSRLMVSDTELTAPAADDGADVRDAIARLEPDLAEIVRLVHWERLTLTDAAEVVGIPASTARGRYQRARDQLRAALTIDVAG